jgi:hypothetical protein
MVQRAHLSAHPRHLGWISRAVASGFLASIAALLVLAGAYGFAAATGSTSPNANVFSTWMWALANNPATRLVASVHVLQAVGLHFVAGVIWAAIYAALVEPVLPGPGWRKGLFFAIVPCLFSLLVFMPAIGVGVFGISVPAGPLPALGAVLLHAVYGVVLGEMYALADGEGLLGGVNSPRARVFTRIERDIAMGIVLGAVLGALVGLALVVVGRTQGSDAILLSASGGATEGAIAGWVVGTFVGLITSGPSQPAESRPPTARA